MFYEVKWHIYVDILSVLTTAVPKMCNKVNDRILVFGFGLILIPNMTETFGPVTTQHKLLSEKCYIISRNVYSISKPKKLLSPTQEVG